LQRFEEAGKEQPLWERVQGRVEAINAWASQVGQELLGRPVSVQQYRQGVGRTAHRKKNQPVEIEVSDTPVTSGHPYGEEIMMGIALHEIGHHLADIGQRGRSTMRGIARSEGVDEIYDILIDERLERIMRSRRPDGAFTSTVLPPMRSRKTRIKSRCLSSPDSWEFSRTRPVNKSKPANCRGGCCPQRKLGRKKWCCCGNLISCLFPAQCPHSRLSCRVFAVVLTPSSALTRASPRPLPWCHPASRTFHTPKFWRLRARLGT